MILPLPGPQGTEPEGRLRAESIPRPPGQLATASVCPGTPWPSVKSQGADVSSQVAGTHSNWSWRKAGSLGGRLEGFPQKNPENCTQPRTGRIGSGMGGPPEQPLTGCRVRKREVSELFLLEAIWGTFWTGE